MTLSEVIKKELLKGEENLELRLNEAVSQLLTHHFKETCLSLKNLSVTNAIVELQENILFGIKPEDC